MLITPSMADTEPFERRAVKVGALPDGDPDLAKGD